MAIDSEWKQAALRRGASACFRHKDFWTTWNNDSFPVIGGGRDCPICHIKKIWKTVRAFSLVLGTKKILTNLVNQLTQGMKQQQQQRKKQNIKAGEGHQITTALSLLKATTGPSPFFFFYKRSGWAGECWQVATLSNRQLADKGALRQF